MVRTYAGINTGQFGDAIRAMEEGHRLVIETEQPIWAAISQMGRAVLLGLQGDEAAAEKLITEASERLGSLRLSILRAQAHFTRGVIAMTAGRQSDAVDHFSLMFLPQGPAFHELVAHAAAPFVIECAVRAGRNKDARRLMAVLEALAKRTPAPLVQIGVRFGRALLAIESDAEDLYVQALDADPKWPFDHARMEMSYGSWLRRQRRITESRPHLRVARDMFEGSASSPGRTRHVQNCALRENGIPNRPGHRDNRSRRRSCRLPRWRRRDSQTARSPTACSFRTARWVRTSTVCSRSLGLFPGQNSLEL